MFAVYVCISTIHTYVQTNKHTFVVHRLVIVLLSKFAPSAHPWPRTIKLYKPAVKPLKRNSNFSLPLGGNQHSGNIYKRGARSHSGFFRSNQVLNSPGIKQGVEDRPAILTQTLVRSQLTLEGGEEAAAIAVAEVTLINDSQVGGRLQLFADNWLLGSRWQRKVVKFGLK